MDIEMALSKSRIDKAGRSLANPGELTIESMELEEDFDEYRISHLEPLSLTTLELQNWLHGYGSSYYIAQRVKRKPQIVRKLRRLSVRLTQLQDIGGCRIIVENNENVDQLIPFIRDNVTKIGGFSLRRVTDYREKGRDQTGYRSAHLLLERDGRSLELQIRSRIQHYWAESIERTSVIYGRHLKEQEGDPAVIDYFRQLSDVFYEIESSRNPNVQSKVALDRKREQAQRIIYESDKNRIFDSSVNEDIVLTLANMQGGDNDLTNWIMVFNWNTGDFVTWDVVGREAESAKAKYTQYESQFSSEAGFEVVMIGSSDIATIRQTHSHYFGIEKFDTILESLDQSIVGFKTRMDIDVGARQILALLVRKKYWGRKGATIDTLKNHFAKGVNTFESSLSTLRERELVTMSDFQAPVSLNIKKKSEIESYL
ncbi:RelA/SpoT domain-containing protein [Sphingomonas oligoaromativorans]|uniref:RelA/SpoT domain-containing protein n=1 Tax=Sphingomonas oligoaromativorans TaxID=575322 RepID=UPI001ABA98E9|nr:RelA/SpoT domain-containing protein [Sphingomonas oligoaromativorans]NIJ31674.1 ppGpp synthetase/RelA/SpoT-type nucleotidyltransferase [Sphingomonas oligoaromativorans]